MRLAIVRRRFGTAGGAERFIAESARVLARNGIAVSLVSEAVQGDALTTHDWLRVPAHRGSRRQRYRSFQKEVAKSLSGKGFDLIQAHERVLDADIFRAGDGVHAAWVDRLVRERSAWRAPFTRLDGYHRLLMETERRMVGETDMVFVANSTLVARELSGVLDVPRDRLRVIENGVDLERFAPASAEERAAARKKLGLAASDRVVAFVGSGFERKGAFCLVRALAQKELEEVKVVVAGRDKHAGRLEALARELKISNRLTLLGAVADVRPVLHAADIMALPTLYDPMPNAALEAVSCGAPVVTTADAGICDHIRDSGAGAIATRDPEDLANGISGVLGRLEEARAAARALRAKLDINERTSEWLSLYRELT